MLALYILEAALFGESELIADPVRSKEAVLEVSSFLGTLSVSNLRQEIGAILR